MKAVIVDLNGVQREADVNSNFTQIQINKNRIYGLKVYREQGYISLNQHLRKTKDDLSKEEEILKNLKIKRLYFLLSSESQKIENPKTPKVSKNDKKDNIEKISKNVEKIYKKVEPNFIEKETQEVKNFNTKFWGKFNPRCEKCKNECKQSHMVTIVNCNKYEK